MARYALPGPGALGPRRHRGRAPRGAAPGGGGAARRGLATHWADTSRCWRTAEAMVKEAPLRERRWQLLALAQYQAGRQTEALRTVHRVKRVLAEQLGIDPGPELAALEEAILRQDDSLLAGGPLPTTGSCPYRGLLPFDLDDHEAFFGRDDAVRACLDILRERGAVSVVGPSGSGKSSLARAGIAAALRLQGRRVFVITPGNDPAATLLTLPRPSERTVLVVDQCEEVFSLSPDEASRAAFLAGLVRWSEHGRLVVAMRADRLAEASAYPAFARLLERSLYLLGAMTEDGLRAAVEAPARQSGLLIEPGLVDVLVSEVAGTAGALPLMSHALLETWKRREANTLTVEGYTASGGIRGAVAQVRRGGVRRHRAGAASGAPRPGAEAGELRHAGRAGTRPATATAVLGGARPPAADRPAGRLATRHQRRRGGRDRPRGARPRLAAAADLAGRGHGRPAHPSAPHRGCRRVGHPRTTRQRALPRRAADPGAAVARARGHPAHRHRDRLPRRLRAR